MNKTTKIIIGVLVIIIIVLGYIAFKSKEADEEMYRNDAAVLENKTANTSAPVTTNSVKTTPANKDQASWYVANTSGWTEHTLDWKTYSIGKVSLRYPSTYVVKTERVETRPDMYIDQTVIKDPNTRSETDDAVYIGIPYSGASDPNTIYDIRENVNNTNITLSIKKDASNYAKYIFSNIVASASKSQ